MMKWYTGGGLLGIIAIPISLWIAGIWLVACILGSCD